jgi:hypothetical protein
MGLLATAISNVKCTCLQKRLRVKKQKLRRYGDIGQDAWKIIKRGKQEI